jgi:hypothetical protein
MEMSGCPKCGVGIDGLANRVAEIHYYRFWREGDSPHYEETSLEPMGDGDYLCPKRGQVLFSDEDQALAFLKERNDA